MKRPDEMKTEPEAVTKAREGWRVGQCREHMETLGLQEWITLHKISKPRANYIDVEWNTETDPTARHALFAATVKYLKEKKDD